MLTRRNKTIALTTLLLDEEETSEDKVAIQKNDYIGFHHDFMGERKIIRGIYTRSSSQSLQGTFNVCLFIRDIGDMLQTMGYVEFVLYYVSEKIFLLLQHHSKIKKRFDLGAVLQQHFVILRATKIILKP